MRSFTGTQKQVTNVDKKLINQFNATKGLTSQLKQNRAKNTEEKRPTLFASVGKELLKQAQQEKQDEKLHPKHSGSQMNIESEVRALSNFQKPNFNPKVEEMVKKQRYSRRERHIKVTDDFENWVQKLNADLDDGYKGIKSDVVDYFKLSDIEIEEYFNSMSDEYLLSREKELLDEMRLLIEEHEKNRNERVQGLDTRLDSQEQERKDNLDFFVENWENQLNEIAFMLKPEKKIMKKMPNM
ncbi:hypothetical protein PPERSA_04559 [Pseudocohnilembus persalinus]|uniref:DUF4455 domain-containing protein n=1 Tax=Pseudocohnilembus persalinus TaxID=266149 RepID=A0A0V0QEB6_PSEPJ|nr:hypothetical protein PPERSA_04559 [Pseudocohnilembus persalinus]|eukprot:KRX00538.1 hypothetical protein PPERSA_04559 [Pseudocohnilembus persalinus]